LELKAYLTTNFDYLLSKAAAEVGAYEYLKYPDLRATDLGKPEMRAVYLHGIGPASAAEPASDLILARDDFEEAYCPKADQESRVLEFLRAVFSENNLLFFACSLNDQWTRTALAKLNVIRDGLITHYNKPQWMMVSAMTASEMSNFLNALDAGNALPLVAKDENSGLINVKYPNFSSKHAELQEILRRLCNAKLEVRIGTPVEVPGPFSGSGLYDA
jgi:hypothetical protein